MNTPTITPAQWTHWTQANHRDWRHCSVCRQVAEAVREAKKENR